VLVAASLMRLDRSGLAMPDSSPLLARGWEGERTSANDLARPKSLFAKASYGSPSTGRATLLASIQNLDAAGEFQDFAPLTRGTRIGLLNQTYRLALDRELDKVALRLAGSYFRSGPTGADRLDLGAPGAVALRDVGTDGFEVSAEASVKAADSLTLTAGADFQHEDHLLQSYDTLLTEDVLLAGSVLRSRGTIIPSESKGSRKRFDNLGAFVQALYQITDSLGLTGGLRADRNSVYGTHLSPRLAGVFAPPDGSFNLKLLYGASFKAPSAEQLYTEPIQPFDVRGNDQLGVQKARTGELAGGYRFGDRGELTASLFLMQVTGRVDYVQRGLYLSAKNLLDEWHTGGEMDLRLKPLPALSVRLGVGVARVVSSEKKTTVVVTGGPEVRQPLFPLLQAHLAADYVLPFWQLRISPEVSFVSAREASQANALLRDEAYALPAYLMTALAFSMPERKLFGDAPTSLSLRISNLLGTAYADPGFNGVDVPAPGRTVLLTLTQGV
jgi:outer membrane receptor protein involved in Fe transport